MQGSAGDMAEESWHQARLIPTSGISGADEQERRATSALLAVMSSVKEFGAAITKPLGAHAGTLDTYIEVPFVLGDSKVFPDGLIRVSRGSKIWTCLVEVKTGTNELQTLQLENYLDVAREQGFDAVLTISNEIPPIAGQHPTTADKRKLRKVSIHHLSWSQILCEAVMQKEHRGVADPDQAWILGELIRYLEHPRSGALEFSDMGESWVSVRNAVATGTLRPSDKTVPEVAGRWDALLRFVSLQLGRRLGEEVTPVLSRKELAEPVLRLQNVLGELTTKATLRGSIRVPNTVGNIEVVADLRANQIVCHVDIDAPKEGRAKTRVNWLIRQLADAPGNLRVEAFAAHTRGPGTAELLSVVREDPMVLVADPNKELKTFRVALTAPLGQKRGRGRGAFIDSVNDAVNGFYGDIVQHLKAWRAVPPPMRNPAVIDVEPVGRLTSTAMSSQDGPEVEPVVGETVEPSLES